MLLNGSCHSIIVCLSRCVSSAKATERAKEMIYGVGKQTDPSEEKAVTFATPEVGAAFRERPKQRAAYSLDVPAGSPGGKPTKNLAVAWTGKEKIEVKDIGYPEMRTPWYGTTAS